MGTGARSRGGPTGLDPGSQTLWSAFVGILVTGLGALLVRRAADRYRPVRHGLDDGASPS